MKTVNLTSHQYQSFREMLFPIAYNMLGSMADAEDIVQETLLKWWSQGKKELENERAYLVRMLVNRCLNFLRDTKREEIQEQPEHPELRDHLPAFIDLGPSLSLGVQAMLARLSPLERAVFLLKDVFGFSHREISEMLDISEEYCRQVLSRARRHLRGHRDRFEVNPDQHHHLFQTFVEVCQGQDIHTLLELLREDIELDIMRPAAHAGAAGIVGKQAVARYLMSMLGAGMRMRLISTHGNVQVGIYQGVNPLAWIRGKSEHDQLTQLELTPVSDDFTDFPEELPDTSQKTVRTFVA